MAILSLARLRARTQRRIGRVAYGFVCGVASKQAVANLELALPKLNAQRWTDRASIAFPNDSLKLQSWGGERASRWGKHTRPSHPLRYSGVEITAPREPRLRYSHFAFLSMTSVDVVAIVAGSYRPYGHAVADRRVHHAHLHAPRIVQRKDQAEKDTCAGE